MGEAILVTSGKGGVGKTSFVAGVSSCLAAMGKRVLCIDLDVGLRNLDLALGLTDATALDFGDVISGDAAEERASVEHPDIAGLFLLNAPLTGRFSDIDAPALRALIRDAAGRYDFVFLDSPAGLGAAVGETAGASDRAVVVSTPDEGAVRDAARAAELLFESGLKTVHLAANRVKLRAVRRGDAPNVDDMMDRTGLPLLGVIPDDELVSVCQNHATPLIVHAYEGAAEAFLNIAKRLAGEDVPLMRIKR